jgi:hypothetical protein
VSILRRHRGPLRKIVEREWLYADGYRYTLECGHKQNRSSRTMFRVRCRECDAVAHGWKAETARPEAQP